MYCIKIKEKKTNQHNFTQGNFSNFTKNRENYLTFFFQMHEFFIKLKK